MAESDSYCKDKCVDKGAGKDVDKGADKGVYKGADTGVNFFFAIFQVVMKMVIRLALTFKSFDL